MYTTAVLQRKFIQTFFLPPPPSASLPSFFCLNFFCLIDVSDGQAGTPAFCSFKEELGGGQGVTLGKVTDEIAGEEGGGEVALKEGGGLGKIDHRVKKPFKKILSRREKPPGHKS